MTNENDNDQNPLSAASTDTNQTPTRQERRPTASNDTEHMKWYVATLCWEQHNLAYVRIQAQSPDDAEEKAEALCSEELDYWDPVYGDEWVESVEPDDGRNDHRFSQVVGQGSGEVTEAGADNE